MANLPISGLPELAAAPAVDDVLPIVDTSATTTKKITVANLAKIAAGAGTEIQYRNSGAFGAMSGTAWDDTNRALTITGATVTTDKPILNLAQTWNAGGVPFTGIKMNVTDTSSNSASKFIDFQISASSKANISKQGYFYGTNSNTEPTYSFIAAPTFGMGYFASGIYLRAGSYPFYVTASTLRVASNVLIGFGNSSGDATVALDTAFGRNSAGVVEVNNGTAGTFRDIKVRDIIIDSGTLAKSSTAFTNGAGAGAGTITNAPAAGNPTKWIPVNDNGTTRYIPAW